MGYSPAEAMRTVSWRTRMSINLEDIRLHHPAWYEEMAKVKKLYDPASFKENKNSKDDLNIKDLHAEKESAEQEYVFPAQAVVQMLAAD